MNGLGGNRSGSAVRTLYFLRIPNVGDRMNAPIVSVLAGTPTRHVANSPHPHLIAIGSVLGSATPQSRVWGSGLMFPSAIGAAVGDRIHAVRGALTAHELAAAGIGTGDIPLGDPGYLAPRLLGILRAPEPDHRLGLVPHYVDRERPAVQALLREDGVCDLDVRSDPVAFLKAMSRCAVIASSSLHGLIFAEALGLPSLWLEFGVDVAGDGFKFRDWFSTAANPQPAPNRPTSDDDADQIIARCEPRESRIDADALLNAFPRQHLEELGEPITRGFVPAAAAASRPTPIFLISFNRGEMLRRAIAGICRLDRPTEIVIQDNGSTDGHTLAILDDLVAAGTRVVRCPAIDSVDDLNRVDDVVAAFFRDRGEPSRYVVSDCDIDVSVCDRDVLEIYDELLDRIRAAECVGPMLRIRDIPREYPLFNRVMNKHIEQFWAQEPSWLMVRGHRVAFIEAPIDTTFALHRAGEPFRRLKRGVRCYEPYEALHLDWYRSDDRPDAYSASSSPFISHWNNEVERALHRDEPLAYDRYLTVRRREHGLTLVEERITTQSFDHGRLPQA